MKKKKVIIIVIVVVLILAAAGFGMFKVGIFGGSSSQDRVYVEQLSAVMGMGSNANNFYMGVVESQDTKEINKATDREVDEILVEVGQEIEIGTELFTYKTADLYGEIKQYGFDIEEIDLQIADYERQIKTLNDTLGETSDENERKDLTNQIDSIKTQIAIANNNKSGIRTKISDAKKKIEESTVTSTVSGTLISINKEGYDVNGNPAAFMSIRASGDIRVKGKINEQNVWSISEGMEVTLRSRVDKDKTWKGVISKIVTDTTENSNNNVYYGGDTSANSSKYPFYVDIDDNTGLMLGQHLYIELSDNSASVDLENATYIYDYYVAYDDNGNPYVWAANSNMKLEKRKVTLGDYNDTIYAYEVVSGLSKDDYICYPVEYLYEGVTCVTSYDEVDESSPMYQNYYDSMSENMGDMEYMDEGEVSEGMEYVDDAVYPEDADIPESTDMSEDVEVTE